MTMLRAFAITMMGALTATFVLPNLAGATPTVRFKARAVPIQGFPHTGNISGAGAAVKAEYRISGTEYGGFPPPLIDVNCSTCRPASSCTRAGFPTCKRLDPRAVGPRPKNCPKGSDAGRSGRVEGYVAFGKEVVPETAAIEAFYAPGGGLTFFTFGHEPVLLEILSTGRTT